MLHPAAPVPLGMTVMLVGKRIEAKELVIYLKGLDNLWDMSTHALFLLRIDII
jgi:hypothetical protein